MFTVEMDDDETLVTVIDDSGELDDVQAYLYDDYCHIRQWCEEEQDFQYITLKAQMYLELMQAWNLPVGAYNIR